MINLLTKSRFRIAMYHTLRCCGWTTEECNEFMRSFYTIRAWEGGYYTRGKCAKCGMLCNVNGAKVCSC